MGPAINSADPGRSSSGLVDAQELARVLGVTLGVVHRLSASGRIPKYKAGHRTVRFDVAEVLRALRDAPPDAPAAPETTPVPVASAGADHDIDALAVKVAATLRRS